MAWTVHSTWLERHFDGTQALDLDGAGASINLGIVTDAAIDPDAGTLYTALTAVATGANWTGPVALTGMTCGLDGSNDLVFDAANIGEITQDAGTGFTNGRSLVIYETTSNQILAHHTEGVAFSLQAANITINFDAAGIFKVAI